jgi:acyl-homoserine lactone acylase PvdQ
LRRGDVDLALGGGPDTLRAIYALPDADGRLRAVAGDGLIIHVAWDGEGVQSAEMIHNFGAAASRPKSRHYADQAPLYAAEQMRPVALTRNEVVSGPHRITLLPHAKTD